MTSVALLQAATERAAEAVARVRDGSPQLSEAASSEVAELAAAIAKDAPGAASDWNEAFPGSRLTFDLAAREGADYLSHPTPTLVRVVEMRDGSAVAYAHALAEVASAACSLGEPTLEVISRGALAAATQLRAAGVAGSARAADVHIDAALEHALPVPSTSAPPADATRVAPGDDSRAGAPPAKSLADLLAELEGLTGLERVKTQVRRQTNMLRANRLRAAKGLRTLDVAQH
ncbi:MAG: hypothetical protein QOI08_2728, partial [Actinomycetota bacterium]|nr:hypothetical protein [Actinomycetota bacterium]